MGKVNDTLSEEGIREYLDDEYKGFPINVADVTTSTNDDAKAAARSSAPHGSVFVADRQTRGKGRHGKEFVTFDGKCIYMSVVLIPGILADKAVLLTTAAALAVCRAITRLTSKDVRIKWVNDIYHDDRKICGILVESAMDARTSEVDNAVIGIGINFHVDAIPSVLEDKAGALYRGCEEATLTRNELIAVIIMELHKIVDMLPDNSFIEEYKEYSMVLGREIRIIENGMSRKAVALDIDGEGALVVMTDGGKEVLNMGEVSIII